MIKKESAMPIVAGTLSIYRTEHNGYKSYFSGGISTIGMNIDPVISSSEFIDLHWYYLSGYDVSSILAYIPVGHSMTSLMFKTVINQTGSLVLRMAFYSDGRPIRIESLLRSPKDTMNIFIQAFPAEPSKID